MTGEGYAALHARSKYTLGRYFLRTVLPWTILTLEVAAPIFIWHYMNKSMEEQRPYITIEPNSDGFVRS